MIYLLIGAAVVTIALFWALLRGMSVERKRRIRNALRFLFGLALVFAVYLSPKVSSGLTENIFDLFSLSPEGLSLLFHTSLFAAFICLLGSLMASSSSE